MSDEAEKNPLIGRVDALLKRHQEATQRADEEVPVLTEIVAPGAQDSPAGADAHDDVLAADLERALIARLAPELDRRLAGLRAELEKDLRRAVREAVAHALAARKAEPPAQ